MTFYSMFIKRLLDLIAAIILMIILSPFLVVIVLLVRVIIGAPSLFKQKRPGLNCKLFMLYKFRTMTSQKGVDGNLLPDKERLTIFGKVLRNTSLDELPELINILKGDMSFVGPRPQLVKDLVFMDEQQVKRQTVKPGLTGLAQVNGRNLISWEEKFKYDIQYISHISVLGDLKILLQTISRVFRMYGVSSDGMETAEDLGDYLLRTGRVDNVEYKSKINESKRLMEDK